MCGIAGFYSKNRTFSEADLHVMTNCLAHRGPDASGFYKDDLVGLGHRRLSIIDLSERANQPMFSSSRNFVIIYNGEVYNYREIGAKQLAGKNVQNSLQLRTASDTEVILESFAKYGPECVNMFNGMFAFAIYDIARQELYIFRDRLGIKPLYYYWNGKDFAFGSELKSLKKINAIPKEIDENSINYFLHLGYIPSPHSIYKNIFKLNPGCYLKISHEGLEHFRYYDLKSKLSNNLTTGKDQAMVKISDLMISSIQYQLKSDVPFGVFLSGGIDSSLVTAQASMLSGVKVNTFSIGFEENSHNESEYAKAIAQYLGTDHHEFIVSIRDAIGLIDAVFESYDEPFADSSSIPTMLVSKLARQHVTVTLSGEGGDELFFGYGAYRWARRLSSPFWKLFKKPAVNVFSKMNSRYKRVAQLLDYTHETNLHSHIFSQEQYYFSETELKNIIANGHQQAEWLNETKMIQTFLRMSISDNKSTLNVKERTLNPMEQQAFYDLLYYLPDNLLTKVDRASMRYSVETRVPYLDHRVVEFALNLSPALKFKNGISKYILKEILYQYIPKPFFDRPKQGFAIPLNIWLKKDLKYLSDEYLDEQNIRRYGLVNPEEVNVLKKLFYEQQHDYLYNRLWLLIVLHRWLRDNC